MAPICKNTSSQQQYLKDCSMIREDYEGHPIADAGEIADRQKYLDDTRLMDFLRTGFADEEYFTDFWWHVKRRDDDRYLKYPYPTKRPYMAFNYVYEADTFSMVLWRNFENRYCALYEDSDLAALGDGTY